MKAPKQPNFLDQLMEGSPYKTGIPNVRRNSTPQTKRIARKHGLSPALANLIFELNGGQNHV